MVTRKMLYRRPISEKISEEVMRGLLKKKATKASKSQLELGFLLAVELGERETMDAFVAKGVSPNCDKDMAMVVACRNEHIHIALWLKDQGVSVDARNNRPLREAAELNLKETMLFLINSGVDVTKENDFAIRRAARYGHFEVCIMLMEKGAKIDTLSENMLSKIVTKAHEKIKLLNANSPEQLIETLVRAHCKQSRTNAGAEFEHCAPFLKPYYMRFLFE